MTSKEGKERYRDKGHYLTVGQLRKQLENFPDDALVVSQRVEDVYYEKHNWETIKMDDPLYIGEQNEYSPVWGICHYEKDEESNCVFLDLHY